MTFLPPPVLTKKLNHRLWQSGAWGTKLRSWRTPEECSDSGYTGLVALRTIGPTGEASCYYDLDVVQVSFRYRWLTSWQGVPADNLTLDEMAPSARTLVQGEYLNDALWPGYFLHSREPLPMRRALRKSSETSEGMRTDMILRGAMTCASWEDWQELLTLYPGHVLEVSVYDCPVGDLPRRNALVWEVRRY